VCEGYSEIKETVGPETASLSWENGGKVVNFASGVYEGYNLKIEREWVAGEVQAWLEQVRA
jgi:hypothetical protein